MGAESLLVSPLSPVPVPSLRDLIMNWCVMSVPLGETGPTVRSGNHCARPLLVSPPWRSPYGNRSRRAGGVNEQIVAVRPRWEREHRGGGGTLFTMALRIHICV